MRDRVVRAVTYYPTFWFGMAIGFAFLWCSYNLIEHALTLKADLTATGVAIGAMAAGVNTLMGLFVYRAVKAP